MLEGWPKLLQAMNKKATYASNPLFLSQPGFQTVVIGCRAGQTDLFIDLDKKIDQPHSLCGRVFRT